jgi:hypothetical protein
MACDICGKTGTSLTSLLNAYQTSDIKDICSGCESIVNKKHGKLFDMVLQMKNVLFKRFINELKESYK